MKIIHISDLHFPKFNKTEKLVFEIITFYKNTNTKPVIIISGDLVDTVSEKDFQKVFLILSKLKEEGFEILLCPGNHDLKCKGSMTKVKQKDRILFANIFSELLPNNLDYDTESKNDLLSYPIVNKKNNNFFIGLDSNFYGKKTAKGTIGNLQLKKLENLINKIKSENTDAIITLYLHHYPFKMKRTISWWFKLRDGEKLLKVIENKVNIVLFGHIHCTHRFVKEQVKYGIDLIQLNGKTLDGNQDSFKTKFFKGVCSKNTQDKDNVRWIEIDTTDYSSIQIDKV